MKLIRVLLITVIAVMAAAAAAEAGVSITPDRHILRLSPGESQTVEYQVYNSGPQALEIEIEPEDWSGVEMADIRGIYSWVSVEPEEFKVEPNQTRPFRVRVTAPADVDGEMVGMLFLCYKEDKGSPLNIRNGIPLYLVIEGTERYSAQIEKIEVEYEQKAERRSLDIMVSVYNNGNIHIAPDISVFLQDSRGKQIQKFFLKGPKIILRNKSHTFRFGWRNPVLAEGDYTVWAEISYEGRIETVKQSADFKVEAGKLKMAEAEIAEGAAERAEDTAEDTEGVAESAQGTAESAESAEDTAEGTEGAE